MTFRLLVLGVLALVSGCAGRSTFALASAAPGPAASPRTLQAVRNAPLPVPAAMGAAGTVRPYLIGPFDKLKIDVFGVAELSGQQVQVNADGKLSFPLAGEVQAAGNTPTALAAALEQRLRSRYLRNPQVTVNVLETVSQVFTVDGEVNQPGLYPAIGRMTLIRAVATARGLTDLAKTSDVLIFREVDGRRMAGVYDLRAIRGGAYEDPEVFPGDLIVVGDSPSRRFFRNIIQSAPLLTTPLLLIFRR